MAGGTAIYNESDNVNSESPGGGIYSGDNYRLTVTTSDGVAIRDINGIPELAVDITSLEITDLLGVNVANIVNEGDGTFTVTLTNGNSFIIDQTASALTGDEIITLINAATGTISADRTEATVTRANTGGTATVVLDTVEISGITYRVGGSTPAHARLRTSLTLNTNTIQLPRLGTVIITGTVSASIENPIAGDVINDVIIHSVHSSYADDRTGTPTVVSDTESRFAWNFQVGDPAQVVTFTVSYSVNGVIDGQIERSNHTETINLTIIAEPQHYWAGAVNQSNLDALTVSLADNQINSISGLTRRDNFTSPTTIEYNGGGAGATPSLYAVIVVDQSINITSLNSDGFPTTISSFNDSTTGRTIYTTEAFLSEGTHSLTWRT